MALNFYSPLTQNSINTWTDKEGRVFLQTYLIDAININKKGWKVSSEDEQDFDNRVLVSKGHPLTLYQAIDKDTGKLIWDHPNPSHESEYASKTAYTTEDDINTAQKYSVGPAKHFKKIKPFMWDAVYEITNPDAKKFLQTVKKEGIKLYTSAHIVRPITPNLDRTNIKDWTLLHNSIVSVPANPQDVSQVREICVDENNDGNCDVLFSASMTSSNNCGYCMGESLRNYVTSQNNIDSKTIYMAENASGSSSNVSTGQTLQTESINNAGIKLDSNGQRVAEEIPETKTSIITDLKNGPSNNNENENAALLEQIKSLQASNNEFKTKFAEIEKTNTLREKQTSIEKTIAPYVSSLYVTNKGNFDEKSYDNDVKRWTEGNLSIDEIKEVVAARHVLSGNHVQKEQKAVTSQTTESASLTSSDNNNETNFEINKVAFNVLQSISSRGGIL